MRIGIISSHAWPLPSPARTGDSQIVLDLSRSLYEMGHEVALFAPEGSKVPDGVELFPMPLSSYGQAEPSADECEGATLAKWEGALIQRDVIHDCSVNKRVAEWCGRAGFPAISTHWGGALHHPRPAINVVAQSYTQRDRLLRGATDYENTATPENGGPNVEPAKDVHVVYNGIDAEFYSPSFAPSEGFFLWLNRWHPVKGYRDVIEVAKLCPELQFKLVGEHPDRDHPYQAGCAREAEELAKGLPNVDVHFLPPDPDHHRVKRDWYRRAKAFLYPTLFQEPFGLSQVEAAACGAIVIAYTNGSVPEVTGFGLVRSGDIGGMADRCRVVAELTSSRLELHGSVARRFDRFVMARNYVAEYRKVINGERWGV